LTSEVSKAVLITGCSSGIGRATAILLAEQGWNVYATARRLESIEDLKDKGCKTLALDVCDEQSMRAAVETIEAAEGAIGVLINNAGYSQQGAVESVAIDEARQQFETNVIGVLRLSQLVLPGMRQQGWGKVVNISSVGGKLTFPGGGIYHASKHAIEAISDAMRFELRGFGVDVILIEPGLITTNFGQAVAAHAGGASNATDVYTKFNEKAIAITEGAFDSPLRITGGGPETVAKKIAKALGKRRPRARYAVTFSAHSMLLSRKLTPDRLWDVAMGVQFPKPGN